MKTAIGMIAALMMSAPALAEEFGDLVDPTRPFSAETGVPVSGGLVLQSTLVSPGRKLAIINGRTLGLGDKLGNAVVAEIRSNEVMLWDGQRKVHLLVVPPLKTQKDTAHAPR